MLGGLRLPRLPDAKWSSAEETWRSDQVGSAGNLAKAPGAWPRVDQRGKPIMAAGGSNDAHSVGARKGELPWRNWEMHCLFLLLWLLL